MGGVFGADGPDHGEDPVGGDRQGNPDAEAEVEVDVVGEERQHRAIPALPGRELAGRVEDRVGDEVDDEPMKLPSMAKNGRIIPMMSWPRSNDNPVATAGRMR